MRLLLVTLTVACLCTVPSESTGADDLAGLWYPLPHSVPQGKTMTIDKRGIAWEDGRLMRGLFYPLEDGRIVFVPDGHLGRSGTCQYRTFDVVESVYGFPQQIEMEVFTVLGGENGVEGWCDGAVYVHP